MMMTYDPYPRLKNTYGKEGYVYLALRWDGLFKIGTSIDAQWRMTSLRSWHGYVALIHAVRVKNPYKVESDMHERYSGNKIKREIFNLSLTEVHDFIMTLQPNYLTRALPKALFSVTAGDDKLRVFRWNCQVIVASYRHGDIVEERVESSTALDFLPDGIKFKTRKRNGQS